MDALLAQLRKDVALCAALEKKKRPGHAFQGPDTAVVREVLQDVLQNGKRHRKRHREEQGLEVDTSDAALSKLARFLDGDALHPYAQFLHFVPRLVNVVTLAEAFPVPGTGLTLPLDLRFIASKCAGAYYAPRRFAAVQLAFHCPRARVLIFHTGRLVGTGTSSNAAARLAISLAQRQLAKEAGVLLNVKNFAVINSVGAASLGATISCDEFASAHTSSAHYDRQSFVGLAWRPPGESITTEIYSTGRANLPGSVARRQLLASWYRMLPELLRFSSANAECAKFPADVREVHRIDDAARAPIVHVGGARPRTAPMNLWDGWVDDGQELGLPSAFLGDDDDDDADLSALGL